MSGLDQAVNSAISGIKMGQAALGVAINNNANSTNDDYSKRSLKVRTSVTAGQVSGVEIAGIERFSDKNLDQAIRNSSSRYQREEVIRSYIEQISEVIGKVSNPNNPNLVIDQAFSSLSRLSNNVENLSLRGDAVNKLKDVTDIISNLSQSAYNYMFAVDKNLESDIEQVNNITDQLYTLNSDLLSANVNNGASDNLMETRDVLLKRLAVYIDFKVNFGSSGTVEVALKDGTMLVSRDKVTIDYVAQQNANDFIIGNYINPITVRSNNNGSVRNIVTGDFDQSKITGVISDGKIKGLLAVRDTYLPKYIQMLNTLAENISFEFNAIHNQGSGFPPSTSYTGTREITGSSITQWSGTTTFAVVDKLGNPLKRDDGSVVKPLNLDLSKLNSGIGAGQPTARTIINEFNQYFNYDVSATRASLGTLINGKSYQNQYLLRDVRIAATSNLSTVPNGTLSFDVELDNDSQFSSQFQVLDVVVKDNLGVVVNGALTTPIPGSFTVNAGDRVRTNQSMTVDFGAGGGGAGGPYTVSLSARVIGENGVIEVGDFNFVIDDNPPSTQVLNRRYIAQTVGGTAVLNNANSNIPYAQAMLVKDDGSEIITDSVLGHLKFSSYDSDIRLVIQDNTSQEIGYLNSDATNKGFGHYFGMNDLFTQTYEDGHQALHFKVRNDIISDPTKLSGGKLTSILPSSTKIEISATAAKGIIKFDTVGPQPVASDTITLNGTTFTFVAGLPANNQIQIGLTWSATIANIMTQITAVNPTTQGLVDQADYSFDNVDTITIKNKIFGVTGNSFSLASNFSAPIISLNERRFASTDSANLSGGVDAKKITSIYQQGSNFSVGANQIAINMANLANKNIFFQGTATTISASATMNGYATSFIATITTDLSKAERSAQSTKTLNDVYLSRFKQQGGVDSDSEMIKILEIQKLIQANSKALTISLGLFKTFLDCF